MAIPGYRIIRKIRQGGMSTVYLAMQNSVEREVALKVMSPSLAADPSFGSRFYREAKIVGKLSHPNIVSIYDVGSHKHYNYIAMDYLPGAPLQDRLEQGLNAFEAVQVIRDIAAALSYAHRCGFIHRDIKPDNILFRDDGSAVLCDFGIAKALKGNIKMTGVGAVLGTPHYMSPEQAQGKSLDGRGDIYSLGVVFFEILTGQVPFGGDEPVAVAVKHMTSAVPKLPRQYKLFQPVIDKMMAKKASDRHQTGEEVIIALNQLTASLNSRSPVSKTHTGSTTLQAVNLISALLAALWSAINLAVKRLMLTHIQFTSTTAPLSNKQLEDLDSFIFNDDYSQLPDELSDIPLIQDTIEQPAIRYRWGKRLWLGMLLVAAVIGFGYFQQSRPVAALVSTLPPIDRPELIATSSEPLIEAPAPAPLLATPLSTSEMASADDPDGTSVQQTTKPDSKPVKAPPRQFPLTISSIPETATIRILNIQPRYQPGMLLSAGAYHIEVQASDYVTETFWLRIKKKAVNRQVELIPTRRLLVAGTLTQDSTDDGHPGPQMVVMPRSLPQDDNRPQLPLDVAIAISQHEITFDQYDYYAHQTGQPLPNDFGWGRGDQPVIGISYHDARSYAAWLSEKTGQQYRLPTLQEWQYAARAGQQGLYWWGDKPATKRANCKRGCKSQYSKLFGSRTAPTGSFSANPYGVYDTAGNVAEWLDACQQWQDESKARCASTLIAGGSHQDSSKHISADTSAKLDTGHMGNYVGMRLLLEL